MYHDSTSGVATSCPSGAPESVPVWTCSFCLIYLYLYIFVCIILYTKLVTGCRIKYIMPDLKYRKCIGKSYGSCHNPKEMYVALEMIIIISRRRGVICHRKFSDNNGC